MSTDFDLESTPIADLLVLQRKPRGDARGFLERLYCRDALAAHFAGGDVAQINRTLTRARGSVRGLHYQLPPHAEAKLVTCLRGSIFDVAVDLRRGSPTFLRWHAEILRGEEHRSLLIPPGFAHGFQALEDDCELLYLHSRAYAPAFECGLAAQEPRLGIDWPLPVSGLSARDAAHAPISDTFDGFDP